MFTIVDFLGSNAFPFKLPNLSDLLAVDDRIIWVRCNDKAMVTLNLLGQNERTTILPHISSKLIS